MCVPVCLNVDCVIVIDTASSAKRWLFFNSIHYKHKSLPMEGTVRGYKDEVNFGVNGNFSVLAIFYGKSAIFRLYLLIIRTVSSA